MIFTKLRLAGFKSFVDATDVLIEPGRSGIVGPNGCGKSNLVEALRWVMGESSYKNMRASGMDDVIFSGSLNRPSRNTAEVTLFIDNKARTAPAIFNDADVLEVTRRIEREAGSVYKINGKDVRARDVQLLFADASTGSRSPSMVRQGQIGELISAKPKARRAILEEAAGISGLYSRRHEAELRLKAAEANLDRLEDVLNQVQQQLDGLKRQSRQASRYKNLSGDIRKADATLLLLQWIAAQEAVTQADAAHKAVTLAMAEKTQIQAETARAEALARHAMPKLQEAEAKAAATLQTLTVARDTLEADEARAKARQRELGERLVQLKADLAREEQMLGDYQDSLSALEAEAAELQAQDRGDSNKADALKAALAEREGHLQTQEQALSELNQVCAAERAERDQLARALEAANRAIAENERQTASVSGELQQISETLSQDVELQACKQAVADALQAVGTLEDAAEAADGELRALRQQDGEARKPLRQAEQDLRALQTEAATLARILSLDEGDLWPPLVDALTVKAGLETALGVALGDDLDASTDENAPSHWRDLPETHRSDEAGLPDGTIPLSDLITAPPLLHRRLRHTGLVDQADGGRLQTALLPGQRLVSREGDLWRWDGFIMAADAPSAAAKRLENKNRLADLEAEAKTKEIEVDALRSALAELQTSLKSREHAEQQARHDLRAARQAQQQAQADLSAAEQARARFASRKAALEEAASRIATALGDAREARDASQAKLAALAPLNAHDDALKALQLTIAEARAAAAEARAALQGEEREAANRRNRLVAITRERENWQRRLGQGQGQLKSLQDRLGQTEAEKQTLDDAPDDFLHQRQALLSKIAKAEDTRASASDARAKGDALLREADQAAKAALAQLSSAREEQVRTEERLEAAKARIAELSERIQDQMECAPTALREKAGLKDDANLPNAHAIETRLDRLKAERERLGGVNLRADEEAGEVAEQLEGLIAERDDLIEAIRRLRTAIAGLNKEGRERLLEAFDTVNGHFQHLFTHLFGGGQAELQLTESDDPLEAGLDIIARPPGKKPQAMTLLSGGEQALTAMALIFAVFLTNPAPICVLDEVDAPLDDANVERFCALVDEMSRQTDTRFVIITHNPITMSRMDRLFGVTMSERGVSQLVSVDLQTAEEYLEATG